MGKRTRKFVPTASYTVQGGAVEIHCFGRRDRDWSMRGRSPEEADRNNPGILEDIKRIAEQYECSILAPHPTLSNAEIVDHHDGGWVPWTEHLYRGPQADAVRLTMPGSAVGFCSADCPALVFLDPMGNRVFAAHCARDSLIDRAHVLESAPPRRYASVIDAIFDRLECKPEPNAHPLHKAMVVCGIGPDNFKHRLYGDDAERIERNRRILAHIAERWGRSCLPGDPDDGRIWLHELIRRQLIAHGVHEGCVGFDAIDTCNDRDPRPDQIGRFDWWSHRAVQEGMRSHPPTNDGRNLVLIIKRV